jgi:glyoxylase-like metal-dependent hydrolase (beta-lactamase superfamily II)
MTSRRTFCNYAVAGAASLLLPLAPRRSIAADELRSTQVAAGLTLIAGAGGNVLVHASDAGQTLVDSGAAGATDALLAALGELPGAGTVVRVFNTHWHAEQIGGNETFGAMSAHIIAHEKTRLRLSTKYYDHASDHFVPALPVAARPAESFYTTGAVASAAGRIDFGYLLEAHTDGDIYVHFRDADVIAVGDVVSPERDPELDWFGGGWIGGRVDALQQLLDMSSARTRFVPSYGGAVGRAAVQAEHDDMVAVFDKMVELIRLGMSPEECLEAGALEGVKRSFGDPLRFVYAVHKSLWAHHNTLSHDIV